jgi:hypothetical protein
MLHKDLNKFLAWVLSMGIERSWLYGRSSYDIRFLNFRTRDLGRSLFLFTNTSGKAALYNTSSACFKTKEERLVQEVLEQETGLNACEKRKNPRSRERKLTSEGCIAPRGISKRPGQRCDYKSACTNCCNVWRSLARVQLNGLSHLASRKYYQDSWSN